jgi:alpha-L-fucosidase
MKIQQVAVKIALLLACSQFSTQAAEPVDMTKRAEELKNLRWGMFICWSFSTFSGSEWTEGTNDVSFFKATEVDTDQWAKTAKEAGMGYILFLTKHVDGFCLWDTQTTEHKVTKAPLGKDVLKLVRESCDKYGIKLALYYCEADIFGKRPEIKKAQLKELLTRYGPIEFLWLDHGYNSNDGGLSHEETTKWCHECQPATLVGYNSGQPSGEISLRECGKPGPLGNAGVAGYNHANEGKFQGYLLAEFTYPILPDHQGGAMWFYSLPIHDNLCKPAEALLKDYLGAVKYGNIFSIDVGPDYNGKLRRIDVETLRKVGEMIRMGPRAWPATALSEGKQAKASSAWGPGYTADKAFDGDEATRWGAAAGMRTGWLEVDLGKEQTIGKANVIETSFPRTEVFAIEYKDGDNWKPLVTGTTIAGKKAYEFRPVNARHFRLNITKANEVPTIEEFQVFPADK